jgi:hypothetical protein
MATRKTDQLYYLRIQLADIEPPIWRSIVVPGQVTLLRLHQIIQVVMGWTFSHLHQFLIHEVYYGEPDPEFGKHYDPNLFSLQAVNSALGLMVSLGLVE